MIAWCLTQPAPHKLTELMWWQNFQAAEHQKGKQSISSLATHNQHHEPVHTGLIRVSLHRSFRWHYCHCSCWSQNLEELWCCRVWCRLHHPAPRPLSQDAPHKLRPAPIFLESWGRWLGSAVLQREQMKCCWQQCTPWPGSITFWLGWTYSGEEEADQCHDQQPLPGLQSSIPKTCACSG